MKRALYLLYTYLVFLLLFVAGKPLFLLYHWKESASRGFWDCVSTLWHGLPMDFSVAGYFTAFPGLLLPASLFVSPKVCSKILQVYFAVVSLFIAVIFIPDLELYSYWGFRIDSTVLTYIVKPAEAAASISGWAVAGFFLLTLVAAVVCFFVLNRFIARPVRRLPRSKHLLLEPASILLLLGVLFIAIRGGVTTSTMNVGKVYFSEDLYLNHAAVNPIFSMLSSLKLKEDFNEQYRFMDDEEATQVFRKTFIVSGSPQDSIPSLLKTNRPNIVFILLESFGCAVSAALGGQVDATPHLDQLASEGIVFNAMYANSFRTDRGIVAALSGYPAQPTMSIIKYPKKSERLPSIMASLKETGYQTSFLYGGDVDFAYIKSYLVNQKMTDITRDTNFPVTELLNKWGAPDHITFNKLWQEIQDEQNTPYLKTFLTLSSHEPFEVPYAHFEHPYVNSVAYTDSCLGNFIDQLKQSPEWDNMLLVLVPDHDMRYPENIEYYAPERHDIFMVWAGGAIKEAKTISTLCSQSDIAATLLGQLGINTEKFLFSRNVLDPAYKEIAFYSFPDGFGVLSPEGYVVYDCATQTVIRQKGEESDSLVVWGKAFLQKLYDDIASK